MEEVASMIMPGDEIIAIALSFGVVKSFPAFFLHGKVTSRCMAYLFTGFGIGIILAGRTVHGINQFAAVIYICPVFTDDHFNPEIISLF